MGKQDSIDQTIKTFAHNEVHLQPNSKAHTTGSTNMTTQGKPGQCSQKEGI